MTESRKDTTKASSLKSYPSLPRFEIIFYICAWTFLYLFALKQVFHLSTELFEAQHSVGLEMEGLEYESFLSARPWKDVSDFDWEVWVYWFWETTVVANVIHFIIMRICEVTFPKYRFHASALYSISFCVNFYGFQGFMILLTKSLLCFSVTYFTEMSAFTWISTLAMLLPFNGTYMDFLYKDEKLLTLFVCNIGMFSLRQISYCLEYCWYAQARNSRGLQKKSLKIDKKLKTAKSKEDCNESSENSSYEITFDKSAYGLLTDFLIYQFYFPLLISGPAFTYNEFAVQIQNPPAVWTPKFLVKFLFGLARYTLWYFVTDFLLHYFYFAAIFTQPKMLTTIPHLTLCGMILCYCQFFSLKYMVMYGLPSCICVADNIKVPGAASCASARHRFTDTWKTFDKGLHAWLVRYVYIPLGGFKQENGMLRNVMNSMFPFVFVGFWHGSEEEQLVWAALNWVGTFTEKLSEIVYKTGKAKSLEAKYLTPSTSRRIRALFSTPLCSLLAVSHVYFAAGLTAGNVLMYRIYSEDFLSSFLTQAALYLGIQTSMEVARYRWSSRNF